MGQQQRRGPPHFQALLLLLGALLLAGPAGGFDGSAASTSGAREQADLQGSQELKEDHFSAAEQIGQSGSASCDGNYNNFLTRKDCLKACGGVTAPLKQDPEVFPGNDFNYEEYCVAKAVTGPCRAAFPRWYFDVEKNTCAHFIYGGCRGNKNSYLTQEDCMTRCFGKHTHNSSHPVMPHSTKAVALAVLLAVMAAVLLGAMVVIFIKIARKLQANAFNTVWSPIDDKEYLVKTAYAL